MKRRRWRVWIPVVGLACLASVMPARAHLVQTGFGSFYDGAAHLVLTPSDLLLVVAAALFAGMRGAAAARGTLFVLPAAWLAGGMLGSYLAAPWGAGWATTLTFGILGSLVALDARFPASAVTAVAAGAGLLHGIANGATLAPAGAGALGMAGVVAAVFVAVSLIASQIVTLRAQWSRVAVRVAGSWIAAAGILMLGWIIREAG